MRDDLYFNELSVDVDFSIPPSSEQEAKDLLLSFVKSCLAYILALGKTDVYVLCSERIGLISHIVLFGNYNVFQLLKKLEADEELTNEEVIRFKQLIGEVFVEEFNPEYLLNKKEALGLGEACKLNAYSISFQTHNEWKNQTIELTVVQLAKNAEIKEFKNQTKHISCLSHVFKAHKVWGSCEFDNLNPSKNLLPKLQQSYLIIEGFGYIDWQDFYKQLKGGQGITESKDIAEIIAKVNGWESIGVKAGRETYQAKNYYLTVDTQHATYEVYQGKETHLGEMSFNDTTLSKQDKSRKLNF